jgi:hypothetical protein
VKIAWWLLLGLLLLPVQSAAQGQRMPRPQQQPPRDVLEAQVFNRFMNRVSADMRLNRAGQARLTRYLRQSGMQRRALAQEAVQLRRRLVAATRDSTQSDADIDRLLQELTQLRTREQELWNRDWSELSSQLTPRQRAVFLLRWMNFNERLRGIIQGRDSLDVTR